MKWLKHISTSINTSALKVKASNTRADLQKQINEKVAFDKTLSSKSNEKFEIAAKQNKCSELFLNIGPGE